MDLLTIQIIFSFLGLMLLAVAWLLQAGRFFRKWETLTALGYKGTWVVVFAGAVLTGNLLLLMVLVTLGSALAVQRRMQQENLLLVLAVAAEKQLPMEECVAAFAAECSGGFGWQVRRLAWSLKAGLPLAEAVQQTPNVLSWEGRLAVLFGREGELLSRSLREALRQRLDRSPQWIPLGMRLLYLLFVLMASQGVVVFSLYFIFPRLNMVIQSFDFEAPPLTQAFQSMAEFFVNHGWAWSLVLLIELLIVFYIVLTITGFLRWFPPGLGWLTRRWDAAQLLKAFALALEAGLTLDVALAGLQQIYPRASVRNRLSAVRQDIQAGNPWWQALVRQRLLLPTEVHVLELAQQVGNLPWAMREMSSSCERRLHYRMSALSEILFPLAVFLSSVPIILMAFASLLPLIEMVDQMASQ